MEGLQIFINIQRKESKEKMIEKDMSDAELLRRDVELQRQIADLQAERESISEERARRI